MDISLLLHLATSSTIFLICCLVLLITFILIEYFHEQKTNKKFSGELSLPLPPGPKSLPIIGNLLSMGGYDVPFKAFNALKEQYGPVYRLDLGSVKSVVVNGIDNIKEVLINKGAHFDSRPNFARYHQLFSGNKENSLAFCDWSDVQKSRREMLRPHTFPRNFSLRFHKLDEIITENMNEMLAGISANKSQPTHIKPVILSSCANIFMEYFCSKRFNSDDKGFIRMIDNFDSIFNEVNQGYIADYLPFLLPLQKNHMKTIHKWSHDIRDFVVSDVIGDRFDAWTTAKEQNDYVDSLICYVKTEEQPAMDWDTALFALEDIIGGHSAVGNLMVKVLGYVATHAEVQKRVQEEIRAVTCSDDGLVRQVVLDDRKDMPYTQAVLLEAIRLIASPIVPHVANRDSSIAGFGVKEGTLIFLNNYQLNMSEELWNTPESFQPERFIRSGTLLKPDHFLPFGGGRRSCMGYKLVQLLGFSIIANLLQKYDILPVPGHQYKVPIGNLAMPKDTFQFIFQKR